MKRNTSKEKKRDNKKFPYKKYYCSIHKGNGNPDCKECLNNLNKLAEDNNAIIIR